MAKAAAPAKSCASCACFAARPLPSTDAERDRVERAGIDWESGQCRRFPESIRRRADDWCGEHREAKK